MPTAHVCVLSWNGAKSDLASFHWNLYGFSKPKQEDERGNKQLLITTCAIYLCSALSQRLLRNPTVPYANLLRQKIL